MSSYHLDHLQYLETEAIHVMREVAAEFERPALLFSGGSKDSHLPALRLAEKGVSSVRHSDARFSTSRPATHEFHELIEFRDQRAKELRRKINLSRTVDDDFEKGLAILAPGEISRNELQIPALLGAIRGISIRLHAIGGARRDEEKGRAHPKDFSASRDSFGQWDPKNPGGRRTGIFTTPA